MMITVCLSFLMDLYVYLFGGGGGGGIVDKNISPTGTIMKKKLLTIIHVLHVRI